MRTKLDQIEARLQALIESSVSLFARGDAQQRLAHQLVEAVQENIVTDPDGKMVAPNIYTIYLHPDSLDFWQKHRSLLDAIGSNLQVIAREYGIQFLHDPILRLAPSSELPLEEIQIVASSHHEPTGNTAAYPIQASPSSPKTIPQNAFLIVEGSRVFPLNRSVINIGRRSDNHLVLQDPRVSRAHAQIRAIRGQFVLFDLNSTGGTLVNGRRIHQYTLKPGDVISLSGVPLIYGQDTQSDDTGQTDYFPKSSPQPPEIIE